MSARDERGLDGSWALLAGAVLLGALLVIGLPVLVWRTGLFNSDTATVRLDPEAAEDVATIRLPPTEGAIEVTYPTGHVHPIGDFEPIVGAEGTSLLTIDECALGCALDLAFLGRLPDDELSVVIRYLADDSEYVDDIAIDYAN